MAKLRNNIVLGPPFRGESSIVIIGKAGLRACLAPAGPLQRSHPDAFDNYANVICGSGFQNGGSQLARHSKNRLPKGKVSNETSYFTAYNAILWTDLVFFCKIGRVWFRWDFCKFVIASGFRAFCDLDRCIKLVGCANWPAFCLHVGRQYVFIEVKNLLLSLESEALFSKVSFCIGLDASTINRKVLILNPGRPSIDFYIPESSERWKQVLRTM